MVKKAKAKPTNKKKSSPKAAAKSSLSAKSAAKYDQPGAPWWKKTALPMPK